MDTRVCSLKRNILHCNYIQYFEEENVFLSFYRNIVCDVGLRKLNCQPKEFQE